MSETPTAALLRRMEEGDGTAADALFTLVYDELHGLARHMMAGERAGHTLQTTALVHEAWTRLGGSGGTYEDRRHFMRVAARAMRRVLVDHARAKRTQKRGGDRNAVPLDEALAAYEAGPTDLIELDAAMERLGEHDPELLQVVELRYFAGLTLAQVGELLGKSVRQVHLAWSVARGWLKRELSREVNGE